MAASGKIQNYCGDQLDVNAKWARLNGCGNCNEQSAVAFVYLRDLLKVRPLDWMAYSTGDLVGSHVFVVVGRTDGTPMADNSSITTSDINSWNESAVMCEAYEGEVYDYPTMKGLLHVKADLKLRYRLV